ncbi:hypothetical protein BD410DRAFT_92741 [Rickenella mellea]|uniref:Uncharacterized protein n=1 Tax=Rickenella mellea TaxID=50990 RepID=A0A4Y7QAP8_9AGAM|nr:hypothetical protein BD410DRAFT_92741 [Rickenella mellea]
MKVLATPLSLFLLLCFAIGSEALPAISARQENDVGITVPQLIVEIGTDTFVDNTVTAELTIQNPSDVEITIDHITASAGLDGVIYASIDQSFSSFVIPAASSASSGAIPNIPLVQGLSASLSIVGLNLDIINANVTLRSGTTSGSGGVADTISNYAQAGVTTEWTFIS